MKKMRNLVWLSLTFVLLLSCGNVFGENLLRVTANTVPEYYQPVSSSGLGAGASGNIMSTNSSLNFYVADFDDDSYDEIYQITTGNEYYVKPVVEGSALTGTEVTSGSMVAVGAYTTGNYLAGDSRDYLLQHIKGSGVDYLRQVNADGSTTTIGVGNIDQYSVMTGSNAYYIAGDYDGNGVADVYCLWGTSLAPKNGFTITNITATEGVLSATDYTDARQLNDSTAGSFFLSGYFVENGGRDQLFEVISGTSISLFQMNNGSAWLSTSELLGQQTSSVFSCLSTDDLVAGDFDNDGFDELLVINGTTSDLYYDNFTITGGVLSATGYTIDAGSPSIFNSAAVFIPEPVTMTIMLTGFAAGIIRRKKS